MGKFHRSVRITTLVFLIPFFVFGAVEEFEGKITRTVDGDTVWVKVADRDETLKIRMVEIDAPEWHVVTPNGTFGQGAFGERSGNYLAEIAPVGSEVVLKSFGKDVYGRTLGDVFVEGKDVNLAMVEAGWAIPYIICSGEDCTTDYFAEHNVKKYLEACESARKAGRGIFDPEEPLVEMPFEFRLRVQEREPDKFVGDFETKEYVKPADYKKIDVCKRIFFPKEKEAKQVGYKKAP